MCASDYRRIALQPRHVVVWMPRATMEPARTNTDRRSEAMKLGNGMGRQVIPQLPAIKNCCVINVGAQVASLNQTSYAFDIYRQGLGVVPLLSVAIDLTRASGPDTCGKDNTSGSGVFGLSSRLLDRQRRQIVTHPQTDGRRVSLYRP